MNCSVYLLLSLGLSYRSGALVPRPENGFEYQLWYINCDLFDDVECGSYC